MTGRFKYSDRIEISSSVIHSEKNGPTEVSFYKFTNKCLPGIYNRCLFLVVYTLPYFPFLFVYKRLRALRIDGFISYFVCGNNTVVFCVHVKSPGSF